MGGIVDSLLVTLGLDTKDFDKARERVGQGLKDTSDAAKKRGQETEDSAKKMGLAFAKLRGEVMGLFLAFAGAKSVVSFAKNAIDATAAAGRTAQVLGTSVGVVGAWGDAIAGAGGQAGEAASMMGKLADIRADMVRNPGNVNMPLMGQLGIHDASDLQDFEQLQYKLAGQYQKEITADNGDPAAIQRTQDTFRQRMKELLGASDEWVTLLESGEPALREEIEKRKEMAHLTKADADAAREFNGDLVRLQRDLVGLFRKTGVLGDIAALTELLDLLSGNTDKVGEHLKMLALGFWGLMHPIDSLVSILAGAGIISQDTARTLMAGDKPPDWMTTPNQATPGSQMNPGGDTSAPGYAGPGGHTRADRNNNPGNLEASPWTRRQPGYIGSDGRFARFATPEAGAAAQTALVAHKGRQGHTLQSLIANYAPGSDGNNVGAYVAAVSKQTGISPYARVTDQNAKAIAAAMARHEGWHGGTKPQGGGNVTVHVDARGATDPHKVATATGHAVKKALRNRHRVANANTGVS